MCLQDAVLALLCWLSCLLFAARAETAAGPARASSIRRPPHAFQFVPKHERMLRRPAGRPAALAHPAATESRPSFTEKKATPASHAEAVVHEPVGEYSNEFQLPSARHFRRSTQGPLAWGRVEYLQWWIDEVKVPPLATTSPPGTNQANAGVLPDAAILFGGSEVQDERRLGGRCTLGLWLTSEGCSSLELSYLALENQTDAWSASSDNFAILARPFFNAQDIAEDSRLIAFDGLVEGSLAIEVANEFHAMEASLRRRVTDTCHTRSDLLLGFRFANLDDVLRIQESTRSLSGPTINTTFELVDQFITQNEFYGGQLGMHYVKPAMNCWTVDFLAKVALGNTRSRVQAAGVTTTTSAAAVRSTTDVGLLAQNSNAGSIQRDELSTLSELSISLRRHFAWGLQLGIGYTFLHWSDVVRAGEQVDPQVNPSQIPPNTLVGPTRPLLPLRQRSFWAQGFQVALEYQF